MRAQSSATGRVRVSSKRVYGNVCSLCCGWVSVGGMEAILNCRTEDLEDYYGLLGCDELSTPEQIVNEFKVRALACHPDKHPENPNAVEEFQKLHEAKEILTDEKKRKCYDLWLRSRITIPFSQWQTLSDSVKTSMHWAVRMKKEPMLEDTDRPVNWRSECAVEEKPSGAALPSGECRHHRFRWAGEAPSGLLLKFRNYEI